jgi:hypothetical protein
MVEQAIGYGVPSEQITFETEAWRDYHDNKQDAVNDPAASWRTWMRNHVKFAAKDSARGRASPATNGHRPVTFGAAVARGNAEADAEFAEMLKGRSSNESRALSRTDEPYGRRVSRGDSR